MAILGAFKEGRGAVGGKRVGCITAGGWIGMLPGRFIVVALPGLLTSVSVFLNVWDGGA